MSKEFIHFFGPLCIFIYLVNKYIISNECCVGLNIVAYYRYVSKTSGWRTLNYSFTAHSLVAIILEQARESWGHFRSFSVRLSQIKVKVKVKLNL